MGDGQQFSCWPKIGCFGKRCRRFFAKRIDPGCRLLCFNSRLAAVHRGRCPEIKRIVIGMEADGPPFLQAIRHGVMGYVVKDASALEIVTVVRTVAHGGAVCSSQLCAFLFRY